MTTDQFLGYVFTPLIAFAVDVVPRRAPRCDLDLDLGIAYWISLN